MMNFCGNSFLELFRRGSDKRHRIATVKRQLVLACDIVILCLVGAVSAREKRMFLQHGQMPPDAPTWPNALISKSGQMPLSPRNILAGSATYGGVAWKPAVPAEAGGIFYRCSNPRCRHFPRQVNRENPGNCPHCGAPITQRAQSLPCLPFVNGAGLPHRTQSAGLPTVPVRRQVSDTNLNNIALEYTYDAIATATDNFADKNKLGSGTYGGVYRGRLPDGSSVAVKRLSEPKEGGFFEEVQVLSKFRHPNLVILMGFARGMNKEMYLIYEMLSKDLCQRLQETNAMNPFPCRQKLSILLDTAVGLSHLHNANPRMKVFHRDIKSQNIMIDNNGTAKMADLGLAVLSESKEATVKNTSGTIGYADPLYISTGVVTEESEVYSFGMVILEILTGKPPAFENNWDRTIKYTWQDLPTVEVMIGLSQAHRPWEYKHIELLRAIVEFAFLCIGPKTQRPGFVKIVKNFRALLEQYDRLDQHDKNRVGQRSP